VNAGHTNSLSERKFRLPLTVNTSKRGTYIQPLSARKYSLGEEHRPRSSWGAFAFKGRVGRTPCAQSINCHLNTSAGSGALICSACSAASCVAGQYLGGCGGTSAGTCVACPSVSYSTSAGNPYHALFHTIKTALQHFRHLNGGLICFIQRCLSWISKPLHFPPTCTCTA
jgi:hypothetical protein